VVSDLVTPVSGTIAGRNPMLEERPELVNERPYADGWLVVIEPSDGATVERLLTAEAYHAFVFGSG